MCHHQPGARDRARRATNNGEYMCRLLSERGPVFFTQLWVAENRIDLELTRESHVQRAQ